MTPGSTRSDARAAATTVARRLREAGFTAYFAGGCVRDELLGLTPTDYDVATDATPDEVRGRFQRTAHVGAHFGVVLVKERAGEGDHTIEVATFRSDGSYSDSRRPDQVTFSSPEEDARRRDFSINALFLDPLADEGGASAVIDHVGGLADLERGLVRAVGDADARLREDHLRALRGVRFAARFGFDLEEATSEAITRHAVELRGVSRERIGDELRRMMAHTSRHDAAWKLQLLGLDEAMFDRHSASAPRTLGRLSEPGDGRPPALATCLSAWALDRGAVIEATQIAGLVRHWRERLCLSNEERDAFKRTLEVHASLERAWWTLGVAAQKRLASESVFTEALRLVQAQRPEEMVRIRARVSELAAEAGGLAPEPLLSGDDLIALGLTPGPRFRGLLDVLYDAQLEGRVGTREDAERLARELSRRSDDG
ncbi:MAG: CCA tRNA nucleotidyltransferase [Planctomycetota bacterium]